MLPDSAEGALRLLGPAKSARVNLEAYGRGRQSNPWPRRLTSAPATRTVATSAAAGAGEVALGAVRSGLTLSIAAIMGAGDVTHQGEAETLDAAIFGAGDVRVRRVTGDVTRRVFGAGEVTVGD